MAAIIYLTVYFLLSISALEFIRRLAKKSFHSHKPLLPPGPSPLHIVGNVLQIDTQEPWITYTNWGKTYGDIVYSRFLNQDVIIINSERVAKDLLDLRSKNYSDKPVVASLEIFGWSWNTIALNYGDTWRQHRRVYHQAFRAEAASKYRPLQMRKVHQLLINLLEAPDAFATHFSTLSASIIMAVTYGYHPLPRNDPLVTLCDTAVALGNEILTPEKSIILGAFPFCKGFFHPSIIAIHRCRLYTYIPYSAAYSCMVSWEHQAKDPKVPQADFKDGRNDIPVRQKQHSKFNHDPS
ncbi:hypothetical protein SERLA73DRAFT_54230 [Serpula lacrymans var. lacrymans S7.3]|uniref:Cytochrome P450 n=1 Tax=Serpula lacrymans var. lacrymans (strain S7.3) TaxID=936435 RepID=F8PYU1_SERL3|nr:hypothetical protein SERLA73DRAFT_54230 [Serpula lacrymans var. lacrymans S7.3]